MSVDSDTVNISVQPAVTVDIGMGTPPGFVAGQIAVASPNLAAGGATSLTVTFVDSNNLLHTQSVNVSFSSPCIASGLATITGASSTTTGSLTVTYSAVGCSGADVINATANVNGLNIATGTVTIAAPSVGSIAFISATPQQIGLQGTGGIGLPETSTLIFQVVDATGGPVAGADVDFTLDTSVGGITLTPTTATSGPTGQVQTVVQAGTVATTVRVTATVTSVTPTISTQSSQLVVSTGIPDQDSFSMAVETHNVEAFDFDGVQVDVTARLSDRFNNPVPDGTAITFNTEGGSIQSQCTTTTTTTESGVCTVVWTSSAPRPANGRVTIVATAIGEESFSDVNGNGVFDDPDSFTDLPEAFRDDNESGAHDAGEFFLDFNQDFAYTPPNTLFEGLLCQDTTGRCSANTTTGISANNIIIMSGSAAVIVDNVGGTLVAPGTVTFSVSDARGQVMPAGTTVKASTTNGQLIGPSNYVMPSTSFNGAWTFPFTVDADTTPDSGLLFVEVKTPGGFTTTLPITVTD